jgi:hypothetical protein
MLAFDHFLAGRWERFDAAMRSAWDLVDKLPASDMHRAQLIVLDYERAEEQGNAVGRGRAIADLHVVFKRSPEEAIGARLAGLEMVESILAGRETSEIAALADKFRDTAHIAGQPHSEWLGWAARFTPAFLEIDLDRARQAAEAAYAFGSARSVRGAYGAFAAQLFAVDWVNGAIEQYVEPLRAAVAGGDDLVWVGALALALAVAHQDTTAILAKARSLIGSDGTSWLGFVGVAMAVEAAAIVGDRETLEAALPLLERRRGDHVVVGAGALDFGPVDRYEALAVAGCGARERALALLTDVAERPTAGAMWRRRANLDRVRLGDGAHGPPVQDSGTWTWLSSL